MVTISSWGKLGAADHEVYALEGRDSAAGVLGSTRPGIPYGNGRSYGDVCLNPGGALWRTGKLDRFIRFDEDTGHIRCEAGMLLGDIQDLAIPRGWALPVTPGTRFVSVGGAIANDVHGKNHHLRGTFGDHISSLTLLRTDGEMITCGPRNNGDWFAATIGGLGLTGLILDAEIQLKPVQGPWITSETQPFENLREFFALSDDAEATWEYAVAWIDCANLHGHRGIFMRGNDAPDSEFQRPHRRHFNIPFTPPFSLINRWTLQAFNTAYHHRQKRHSASRAFYESYLYPLDGLCHWNRLYGPRGFYQYQAVVPRNVGEDATMEMLQTIRKSGDGSPLAVLKKFGNREAPGMLSFPKPGVTLALDFPNRGQSTLALFARLDAIVSNAGGRLYAAKDARMPAEMFVGAYPRLNEFVTYRDTGISSSFSRRIMGS